jgi:hypothetical protein
MSAAQFAHVQELLAPDAQRLVESLRQFSVAEIGSKAWLNQHVAVEKLNLQAQHSILKQGDEYVIEALVDYDKLPILIAELIALEAWQEQALPTLFDEIASKNSVKGYFILYHEALVVGLLEKAVFHKHAIAAAGDMLLELADFCYRKALFLNHGKLQQFLIEPNAASSASESFRHQQFSITYGVAMSCLTIIRFLLEAQDDLPLGVLSRFTEENDVLHAVVPLLESQPWLRKSKKGASEKFSDGRWYEVEGDEVFRLSKTEAQVCRNMSVASPSAQLLPSGVDLYISRLPRQRSAAEVQVGPALQSERLARAKVHVRSSSRSNPQPVRSAALPRPARHLVAP